MDKVHVVHQFGSINGVEKGHKLYVHIYLYMYILYKGVFSFIYPLRLINFIIISSL